MITSLRNPLVKRIRRLQQKKYRQQEGAFFAEGLRVVLAAAEAGATLEAVVTCSQMLDSAAGWQLVAQQRAAGVLCVEVSADVFRAISSRHNPVGLGAIVKRRWLDLEGLPAGPDDIVVALAHASDPGNLGTILRTMDAVGAAGLVLVGSSVDPSHPTAVKASMGALFTVPISMTSGMNALMDWAAARRLFTIATSAHAEHNYKEASYRFPALLLLGSERHGLDPRDRSAANVAVSIPMVGSMSSLNLAVAAGLLLYELSSALRRAREAAGSASQLVP